MTHFLYQIIFVLLLSVAICFAQPKVAQKSFTDADLSTVIYRKTIQYLDHLESLNFSQAAGMLYEGFPQDKIVSQLKETWTNLINSRGDFLGLEQLSLYHSDREYHLYCQLILEKQSIGLNLNFNKLLKINKFAFIPIEEVPESPKLKIPYDRPANYSIQKIRIGSDKYSLKSKLYLPKQTLNPPVVIFTHDFGPQDLEHRTGINGFFKDIAVGLASNGIASLLFPKRSSVYSPSDKQLINPSWEVLEDIYNAIFQIKALPDTHHSQLILLSYGFSSYFVPYISRKKLFNGYILLNPSFRNPVDILFEIEEFYQSKTNDPLSAEKYIENLYKRTQLLHKKQLNRTDILFKYPAAYFYSLAKYRPAPMKVNEVSEPFLSLFANKDFASNPADPQLVNEVLKNASHQTESFPGLNRIFHIGEGQNPREDFFTPGIVSAHALGRIKRFVTELTQ